MKKVKNTPKWLALMSVFGLLTLLLSSCLKDNNNANYNPPVAFVTFVQASPGQPPLNLSLNNNLVNSWPLNFGDHFDYFRAYAGARQVNINNSATGSQVLSDSVHLSQGQTYSLFLVNIQANPQLLLLSDTLKQPATGKAAIRFVNLGPDAAAVDFAIHGSAPLVSNKSFKGHSSFIQVAANSNVTLDVLRAGTSTVLASLPNVPLNAGFVYTVWLQGLTNTTVTGQKLGINLMVNATYNF